MLLPVDSILGDRAPLLTMTGFGQDTLAHHLLLLSLKEGGREGGREKGR